MLVNPIYGASGSSPTPPSTVLPEMRGVKYFYDLTNISAGGDIEVPNTLEKVEPLVLHGATVTDNAIQLTGEANNSYGTFNASEIATTHEATVYIVYKTINLGTRPAILTVWSTNSSSAQDVQIRDQSSNDYFVPTIRNGAYDGSLSSNDIETKTQFVAVVLQRLTSNNRHWFYIKGIANVNSCDVIPISKKGEYGFTMGEASGKISLMSENVNLADCTANVRVIAVADAYHNTNEIIRNLGYLSQHYIEAYNM